MSNSMEFKDFRVVSSNTVYKKQSTNGIVTNGHTSSSNRLRYTLGDISSTNIVLDVNVGNGWTRIRLKQVPKFIVHAFNMISKFGMDVDGIFRKEGNSARLNRTEVQNIYKGVCDIPSDYTVIDVCTLVKRFLRDLKPSLLDSDEFRDRLLIKAAHARVSGCFTLSQEEMATMSFSENPSGDGKTSLLSEIHFSTLGYVMRQLNRISAYSGQHKMSADNLAVVLVGSVFGNKIYDQKKIPQTRRCSQDDILAKKKQDMNVHVAAVKLLIINANLIGIPKNPYITSNAMTRSSSAMSTIRFSNSGYETESSDVSGNIGSVSSTAGKSETNEMSKASTSYQKSSDGPHKVAIDRKKSELQKDSTKKKRASSFLPSFRGIKDRFSKRVKSPSPERVTSGHNENNDTNSSSDQIYSDNGSLKERQQKAKVNRNESNTLSTGSTASGRQSRSQQSKRGNTNAAPKNKKIDSDNSEKLSLAHLFDQNRQIGDICQPLKRLSQSEQNSEVNKTELYQFSNEKMSVTEFIMAEYNKDCKNTKKETNKKSKDGLKEIKKIKNRRHTAPVNNGLRRHRPNTVGAGLPHRRATMKESRQSSSSEEKENKNSETDDSLSQTIIDANLILERKGLESRSRRAARKTKVQENFEKETTNENFLNEETSESNSIKNCESSSGSQMNIERKDLEIVKNEKQFCDIGTSPMTFDSPLKHGYENGHVWIGDKQIINYSPSPSLVKRSSRARLSYAKANESPIDFEFKQRRESLGNAILSPVMKHVAITNNSPPAHFVTTTLPRISSLSQIMNKSPLASPRSFESLPPPIPPHSPPQITSTMIPVSKNFSPENCQKTRPPTPPSNPRMPNPFSPKLSRVSQLSMDTSFDLPNKSSVEKNESKNEGSLFKMPSMPQFKMNQSTNPQSQLTRQPIPTEEKLISIKGRVENQDNIRTIKNSDKSSKNTMSPRSCEYFGFGKYTNMLKDADNEKTLVMKTIVPFEPRPSVAIIRAKNCGLVKSRVNQFQGIEQLSKNNESSGRNSSMSYVSSRNSDVAQSSDRLSDVSEKNTCEIGSSRSFPFSSSSDSVTTPTSTCLSNRF